MMKPKSIELAYNASSAAFLEATAEEQSAEEAIDTVTQESDDSEISDGI